MQKTEWQPVKSGPTHRSDVLIKSAGGNVGVGWFSQMEDGPSLNVEYLSSGGFKPTLEEHIESRLVTHWMEVPQ